ncbi:MAG TPA: hypothetical protein VMX38_21340 [Verrucomicrobiae bacterium]|nr:hypothetical protein [Verrucomicrobiae bacterium]
MASCHVFLARVAVLVLFFFPAISNIDAQGAKQGIAESKTRDADADHVKERSEWFLRGRTLPGKTTAELRHRAYEQKLSMRANRAAKLATHAQSTTAAGSIPWAPLGPVPLASDATGNGTQDYHQVAGPATAVAIDPSDPTGNTVYIGGAQGGIWKTTNGANSNANNVTWAPVADDQPTLSIGAIAVQAGNIDPANSLILAATGEANNSFDSYFGLGILRSTNAGTTWTLISTANNGAFSFSGLGGTRMAFSTSSTQLSTVVAAMATSSVGEIDGAVTSNTTRGLYTSLDAGQTWAYDVLTDPGGATDATSATSVVYNATAGLFLAAVRYHGFYSSPDGLNWTRLATQPGGSVLSTTACPPQSTSNNYACPIYRGEITVVPGRNEMYAWHVSISSDGGIVDGGIWQSLNGGASWTQIIDSAIANCGDVEGCGVDQGSYNLELAAVPNGAGTDLYAGAINIYKCSISSQNQTCSSSPFINLTHAYGCDPIGAPAHVHPDQHALTFVIPPSSNNDLMYFANDGGIYRALNGFTGLGTGSCSGTNAFDDLNQNLGSMTQFVAFAQHPTNPNTLLGGTQDNGSPATSSATVSLAWGNVLGGDGGYNAIDPNLPTNFYASNPDIPPSGLGIQLCPDGEDCNDSTFDFVVTSDTLGGDDGAFYFPYVLDTKSTLALLVGTCRIWRGPRIGGTYTVLSPNFDTLGSGTCTGSEVNQVRAIAAGGPSDSNGSMVVYATTDGYGPLEGPSSSPAGGNVWVTTNATAGFSSFSEVTNNGPQGGINPNQFPISAVAIDSSDATGATAYVTVMGFTGGTGHVWKTTNFGVNWSDFTANLPDSPANAIVVDPPHAQVYVGTDVGVFASSTSAANWTELGPNPATDTSGFLPNVAVTALALFNSGGEELLRASTYGRGIWQFPIAIAPDYLLAVSNSPLTGFANQTVTFDGTATSLNGYNSTVSLSCIAGTTPPPSPCTISPLTITPGSNTTFTVNVAGQPGTYNFNIQGVGSDSNKVTHAIPVILQVVSFALSTPSPSVVTVPRGTTSAAASFQVTAAGNFNQSVSVSCDVPIANASCNLSPGTSVNPTSSNPVNMTATVTVPASTAVNTYAVTIQATTAGEVIPASTTFSLNVTTNPSFALAESSAFPEVNAGSTGTNGPISITAQDGFSGTVNLSCGTTFGANSCSVSPSSVSTFPATATLVINGTSFTAGSYSLTVTGTSGTESSSVNVPFNIGDYTISGPQSLASAPGGQTQGTLTLTAIDSYSGQINASCDASALTGSQCVLSPVNPITLSTNGTATLTVSINIPNSTPMGNYNIQIKTTDTTGAPSHSLTIPFTATENFSLTSTTLSQTVNPGQTSGPYNLSIQPVGTTFTAAITLACSGLPTGTQCLFNPSTPVTPGNSAQTVVMTISTSGSSTASLWPGSDSFFCAWFILCAVAGAGSTRRRRAFRALLLMVVLMLVLAACSGVSGGGGGGGGGGVTTPAGTYTITVTGSSQNPTYSHSTQVTLVVN